jgi:hypothetical protein
MKKWRGLLLHLAIMKKSKQKGSHFQNINQQMTWVSISTFTVDLLVAGKIEFMKVISLEIANPTTCVYVNNHEMPCNVTKRGFHERLHCYDIDFPFYLQYQRWICHERSFTALHPKLIESIPPDMLCNIEIVVMGQIVLVLLRLANLTTRPRD